jgi:hypothetical protein
MASLYLGEKSIDGYVPGRVDGVLGAVGVDFRQHASGSP